jgi:hypothetical protein
MAIDYQHTIPKLSWSVPTEDALHDFSFRHGPEVLGRHSSCLSGV